MTTIVVLLGLAWLFDIPIPLWLIIVFTGIAVVIAVENDGIKTRDAVWRANHPYDDWD